MHFHIIDCNVKSFNNYFVSSYHAGQAWCFATWAQFEAMNFHWKCRQNFHIPSLHLLFSNISKKFFYRFLMWGGGVHTWQCSRDHDILSIDTGLLHAKYFPVYSQTFHLPFSFRKLKQGKGDGSQVWSAFRNLDSIPGTTYLSEFHETKKTEMDQKNWETV